MNRPVAVGVGEADTVREEETEGDTTPTAADDEEVVGEEAAGGGEEAAAVEDIAEGDERTGDAVGEEEAVRIEAATPGEADVGGEVEIEDDAGDEVDIASREVEVGGEAALGLLEEVAEPDAFDEAGAVPGDEEDWIAAAASAGDAFEGEAVPGDEEGDLVTGEVPGDRTGDRRDADVGDEDICGEEAEGLSAVTTAGGDAAEGEEEGMVSVGVLDVVGMVAEEFGVVLVGL